MLPSRFLKYELLEHAVVPFQLGQDAIPMADALICSFASSRGLCRRVLKDQLRRMDRNGLVQVFDGLVHLLLRRSTFVIRSLVDPEVLRKRLFETTGTRQERVESVGQEFGIRASEVERSLYADLPDERVLMDFEVCTPQELVDFYNLSQAQGLLYYTTRMCVRFFGELKKVMTHVLLSGLLYRFRRISSQEFVLELDGPLSCLRRTKRYGISMAKLLPAILLADRWSVSADVQIKGRLRQLNLGHQMGLKTSFSRSPLFDSSLEEAFAAEFAKLETDWSLEREGIILEQEGKVMIPDFSFRHPDGRLIHLEIIGFWTPEYLEKKLSQIHAFRGRNLLVAVSTRLASEKSRFSQNVLWFEKGLNPGKVLRRFGG